MAAPSPAKPSRAAQDFVPVKEVRGGVMVLKDGTLVGVLLASSLNFALKSGDEQSAILAQFQAFLNSLDFSVQFFVRSRKLDIRPYVALLEERGAAQTEDLLQIQIREYIDFVKTFTHRANIMSKTFFIVVPYTPAYININKTLNINLFPKKAGDKRTESEIGFDENRTQLEQRMAVVEQGLIRCGIRTAPLGTEEVIELLYKEFNPGDLEKPISVGTQSNT